MVKTESLITLMSIDFTLFALFTCLAKCQDRTVDNTKKIEINKNSAESDGAQNFAEKRNFVKSILICCKNFDSKHN